jgi:hypothetical protein
VASNPASWICGTAYSSNMYKDLHAQCFQKKERAKGTITHYCTSDVNLQWCTFQFVRYVGFSVPHTITLSMFTLPLTRNKASSVKIQLHSKFSFCSICSFKQTEDSSLCSHDHAVFSALENDTGTFSLSSTLCADTHYVVPSPHVITTANPCSYLLAPLWCITIPVSVNYLYYCRIPCSVELLWWVASWTHIAHDTVMIHIQITHTAFCWIISTMSVHALLPTTKNFLPPCFCIFLNPLSVVVCLQ